MKRYARRLIEEISDRAETWRFAHDYKKWNFTIASNHADLAVVIHLFYTELWTNIEDHLKRIDDPFDLFVTLPEHNRLFESTLKRFKSDVTTLVVPNRGRDVLPFIMLADRLHAGGYKSILKLHSKKSPHWDDGDKWFNELLDALLPARQGVIKDILKALRSPKTALVGPKGHYYDLRVYYRANRAQLLSILRQTLSERSSLEIDRRPEGYGFFGGTMFWINLEPIEGILKQHYGLDTFQGERGQVDGTFAHAMERAFTIVPEANGKDLYQCGPLGVEHIRYDDGMIPEASDLYRPDDSDPA